ncbi:unnamed protein product [Schistocephalus solidus]|uniref:Uncharacterized protein n=1 Tax=Schistocephalus solidus TaxID=70667 RepID=A0A183T9B8_SCHSO|nr:unnamed protein product [Schistocephalus solidus]
MPDSRTSHLTLLSKIPTVVATATPWPRLADQKIRGCKTQTNNNTSRPHPPRHTLGAAGVNPLTLAALKVRFLQDNPRSNWSDAGRRYSLGNWHSKSWTLLLSAGEDGCRLHLLVERRDAGVTFAIRNDIVGRLPCLPHDFNDHLMSHHLPLWGDKFATIISA